jgi:hypothetical protein
LERSDRKKGEPDHAASPLVQELKHFQRRRISIAVLERSDKEKRWL